MSDLSDRIAALSPAQQALLARRLASPVPARAVRPAIPTRPDRAAPQPLSFAQERLWVLDQLAPGALVFLIPAVLRLRGPLDRLALERAFSALVARHEVLRTTFAVVDQAPAQLVHAPQPLELPLIDLQPLPWPEREARAEQLAAALFAQPFDLERGPLLRVQLLALSPTEHRLLLALHHSVCDGPSMALLIRDLAALYQAELTPDDAPGLPALTIQYADYAAWQRQTLQGAALQSQLDFWRRQLADAPPLALPLDHPRPAQPTGAGATHPLVLPPTLTTQLRQLSRESGVTLFVTLLAALDVLLARLSGQDDLCVGTFVTERTQPATADLVGFFVNTLVLRTRIDPEQPFLALLDQVKATVLDAFAHQDVPFQQVLSALPRPRTPQAAPLVSVLLSLQAAAGATRALPTLMVEQLPQPIRWAEDELTLWLVEGRDGSLRGSLAYRAELFAPATIARLAALWTQLLGSIVADPTTPVGRLELLPPAARTTLLQQWNATAAAYPAGQSLPALIAAQAARTPQALAVSGPDSGESLSYAALIERATTLAQALAGLPAVQTVQATSGELRIGLALDRTPALVVALLAVLQLGGAYVPLDVGVPPARLALIIEETAPALLLTQPALAAALPTSLPLALVDDQARPQWSTPEGRWTPPTVDARQAAYVIATSGSTGRPKGVVVPHAAVVPVLHGLGQQLGLGQQDVLLAVTTVAFDIAALELLLPLLVGAQVVVVPRTVAVDGPALAALLSSSRATVLQATPATWRLLLAAGWSSTPGLTALCGGEALPAELAAALLSRVGQLWNVYGPTETTIWTTSSRVVAGELVTIGRPLRNTQAYVLDEYGEVVPIGVVGELWIGGAGVSLGYAGQPARTAERFRPDPFGGASGARLYGTGDRARWRADGTIEWLGRLDHQVKVRGYRIELGEIEAALRQAPGVEQAVAVVREDQQDEKQIVAYFTVMPAAEPTALRAAQLRSLLSATLPDYMIPAAYVQLPAFPLTPNGKLDRRALPAPAPADQTPLDLVAPRDIYEIQLAQIFALVLDRPVRSVTESFFALGGTSLLAVRVMERIARLFGWQLAATTLFAHPTIEGLAEVLRQLEGSLQQQVMMLPSLRRSSAHTATVVELTPGDTRPPFFCVTFLGGVIPPTIFGMGGLAGQVGPQQPFYGIQPPALYQDVTQQLIADQALDNDAIQQALNAWQPDPQMLVTTASACVAALRAVQPHGPYHLGGVCSGGILAFEMAQQLLAAGQEVAILVMLDAPAPRTGDIQAVPLGAALGSEKLEFALLCQFAAWDLGGGKLADNINVLRAQLAQLAPEQRWPYILERALAVKVVPLDTTIDELQRLYVIFKANLGIIHLTLERYQPQPYAGRIALFQVQETVAQHNATAAHAWAQIGQRVDVYTTPGDHGTMLKTPHVEVLADLLRQCLGQAGVPPGSA